MPSHPLNPTLTQKEIMSIHLVIKDSDSILTCVGIFPQPTAAHRCVINLIDTHDPGFKFSSLQITEQQARSISVLATTVRTEDHPITYAPA